jgi:two-component system, OmpR family, response regulator
MRVLVAEDERKTADFVKRGLEELGHTVELCRDGNAASAALAGGEYDAAILDIMMPGRDGLSVLKELRRNHRDLPVILLTARGALNERLEGFEAGADDYLTKPFFIEELAARLHTLVRRAGGQPHSVISNGLLVLNVITREVRCGDALLDLTAREFALLEHLAMTPGRVLTRTQLYTHVWNIDYDPGTNLVDVYIRRLREKMHDAGLETPLIETVRGVGYKLTDLRESK